MPERKHRFDHLAELAGRHRMALACCDSCDWQRAFDAEDARAADVHASLHLMRRKS